MIPFVELLANEHRILAHENPSSTHNPFPFSALSAGAEIEF
jgi:hypothetical protein